ncbi:hypothetical protein QTP86_001642 [Hemibagrus guttatus]|nr:hypothetical protein QTP86_001642 [Hemibagrus guttatus]
MKVSRIQSNGECGKEVKKRVQAETVSLRKRQESELESAHGHCPEERFTEAVCTEKMEQLRKDLKALKGEIEARNNSLIDSKTLHYITTIIFVHKILLIPNNNNNKKKPTKQKKTPPHYTSTCVEKLGAKTFMRSSIETLPD